MPVSNSHFHETGQHNNNHSASVTNISNTPPNSSALNIDTYREPGPEDGQAQNLNPPNSMSHIEAVGNSNHRAGSTDLDIQDTSTNRDVARNLLRPTTRETRGERSVNASPQNVYRQVTQGDEEAHDIPSASSFLPEITPRDLLELGFEDLPTSNGPHSPPSSPSRTPMVGNSTSSVFPEFHLSLLDTVHAPTSQDDASGNNQMAVSEPSVLLSQIWSYSTDGFDVFNNIPTQTSTMAATDDMAHAGALNVVENGNRQALPPNMLPAHASSSQSPIEQGQVNLTSLVEDEDANHGINGNASNHTGQPSDVSPESSLRRRSTRLSDYLLDEDPETRAQWQDLWDTDNGTERPDSQTGGTLDSSEMTGRQSNTSLTMDAGDVNRNRRAPRNVVPSLRRT